MTSSADRREESLAIIQAMAHQLLEVLEEETRCLAERDHGALLAILPQKEALARRLSESLRPWAQAIREGHREPDENREVWTDLKETLRHIEARNEANGRYIEELIQIHEELLSLLVPHTYGHGAQKSLPAVKGYGISTEA